MVLACGILLLYVNISRTRKSAKTLCADSSIMDIALRTTAKDSEMAKAHGIATFAAVAGAYVEAADYEDVTGEKRRASAFARKVDEETGKLLHGPAYDPREDSNTCSSLLRGYERLMMRMGYWPDEVVFRVLMFTDSEESIPCHAVVHARGIAEEGVSFEDFVTERIAPLFASFEKAYSIEVILGAGIRFEIPR